MANTSDSPESIDHLNFEPDGIVVTLDDLVAISPDAHLASNFTLDSGAVDTVLGEFGWTGNADTSNEPLYFVGALEGEEKVFARDSVIPKQARVHTLPFLPHVEKGVQTPAETLQRQANERVIKELGMIIARAKLTDEEIYDLRGMRQSRWLRRASVVGHTAVSSVTMSGAIALSNIEPSTGIVGFPTAFAVTGMAIKSGIDSFKFSKKLEKDALANHDLWLSSEIDKVAPNLSAAYDVVVEK